MRPGFGPWSLHTRCCTLRPLTSSWEEGKKPLLLPSLLPVPLPAGRRAPHGRAGKSCGRSPCHTLTWAPGHGAQAAGQGWLRQEHKPLLSTSSSAPQSPGAFFSPHGSHHPWRSVQLGNGSCRCCARGLPPRVGGALLSPWALQPHATRPSWLWLNAQPHHRCPGAPQGGGHTVCGEHREAGTVLLQQGW